MINVNTIDKKITRGAVLVKAHEHGGCYWITPLGEAMVKIEQNEIVVENKKFSRIFREAMITGNVEDAFAIQYYKGMILPGNIHILEQLEPPIPDEPEECLYWLTEDRIARDEAGNAIYRYSYYAPGEVWNKSGEIDSLLI